MNKDLREAAAYTTSSDDEPMEALARDVLPALIARLGTSGLAELEVATDVWRVRLRRDPTAVASASGTTATETASESDDGPAGARSPGVGYFDPGPGFAVGTAVTQGDRLGSVEVLGIAQEVISPADGVIGRIHAEPGQAVEYGQRLATIGAVDAGGADQSAQAERASD